jgi:hypothetical protein
VKWREKGEASEEVFAVEVDATKARGEVFTAHIETTRVYNPSGNINSFNNAIQNTRGTRSC